jgi:hypothetical protein
VCASFLDKSALGDGDKVGHERSKSSGHLSFAIAWMRLIGRKLETSSAPLFFRDEGYICGVEPM